MNKKIPPQWFQLASYTTFCIRGKDKAIYILSALFINILWNMFTHGIKYATSIPAIWESKYLKVFYPKT